MMMDHDYCLYDSISSSEFADPFFGTEDYEEEKMIVAVRSDAINDETSKQQFVTKPRKNDYKRAYQRNRLFMSLSLDCTECGQVVDSENNLKKHLRDIHRIANHRCYLSYCNQSFKRSVFLEAHISECHSSESHWECAFCQLCHNSNEELKNHIKLCHQWGSFSCNYQRSCDFHSENREQMLQHLREYHESEPEGNVIPKNFICNFEGCDQAFATNALVRRHQLFHLKIKPYSCKLCSYESEVRYATIVHIRTVHMGLPAYLRDQQAKNIVDDRDPATYLHVAPDKLNQMKACTMAIKRRTSY